MVTVSPRVPRIGQVPAYRLRDARRVRDELRESLDCKVFLTVFAEGFGVVVYHRNPTRKLGFTIYEGVPVVLRPKPIVRPRR